MYSTVIFEFIYCALTSVPHTTYPHTTHTGCAKTVGWLLIMATVARGCATTVGWLHIMITVGKTHAVKYTKEATLTNLYTIK